MSRYTSATDADRQAMLEAIGVDSIDDLFAAVPEGLRLGRPLAMPDGKPEQEVYGYAFEGTRYDSGTTMGWLKASVELALQRPDLGAEFRDYLKTVEL